jgi:hypothetical protein
MRPAGPRALWLHLFLVVVTSGAWIPIWIALIILKRFRRAGESAGQYR